MDIVTSKGLFQLTNQRLGGQNTLINSANILLGTLFEAQETGSLSLTIMIYITNGTVTNIWDVELWTVDANDDPDTLLYTATATPATVTNRTFALGNVTQGVRYLAVCKNTNGTPASNNFSVVCHYKTGEIGRKSTDGGSTWFYSDDPPLITQVFGSNSYAICTGRGNEIAQGTQIYFNGGQYRRGAVAFKPKRPLMVRSARMSWSTIGGSPNYNIWIDFFEGTTHVAQSTLTHNSRNYIMGHFDGGVVLDVGKTYYIAATGDGGDSTNRVGLAAAGISLPTDILSEFGGGHTSIDTGTPSWSGAHTSPPATSLFCEEGYSAGGSGLIVQRGFNGGFPR